MGIIGQAFVEILPFTAGFAERTAAEVDAAMAKATAASQSGFDKLAGIGKGALLGLAAATVTVGAAAIHMADQYEGAHARLQTAVAGTGHSLDEFNGQIAGQERHFELLGFSAEQYETALGRLTETIHDPQQAIKDMGLAANIAAARHMDLTAAAQLVGRVAEGNTGVLRRLGIATTDAAGHALTATQAFEQLNKQYGGAAQAQADTFAGKIKAFEVTMKDLATSIGLRLIPVLQGMFSFLESGIQFFERNQAAAIALGVAIGGPLLVAIGAYVIKLGQAAGEAIQNFLKMTQQGAIWVGEHIFHIQGWVTANETKAASDVTTAAQSQAAAQAQVEAQSRLLAAIQANTQAIIASLEERNLAFESNVAAAEAGAAGVEATQKGVAQAVGSSVNEITTSITAGTDVIGASMDQTNAALQSAVPAAQTAAEGVSVSLSDVTSVIQASTGVISASQTEGTKNVVAALKDRTAAFATQVPAAESAAAGVAAVQGEATGAIVAANSAQVGAVEGATTAIAGAVGLRNDAFDSQIPAVALSTGTTTALQGLQVAAVNTATTAIATSMTSRSAALVGGQAVLSGSMAATGTSAAGAATGITILATAETVAEVPTITLTASITALGSALLGPLAIAGLVVAAVAGLSFIFDHGSDSAKKLGKSWADDLANAAKKSLDPIGTMNVQIKDNTDRMHQLEEAFRRAHPEMDLTTTAGKNAALAAQEQGTTFTDLHQALVDTTPEYRKLASANDELRHKIDDTKHATDIFNQSERDRQAALADTGGVIAGIDDAFKSLGASTEGGATQQEKFKETEDAQASATDSASQTIKNQKQAITDLQNALADLGQAWVDEQSGIIDVDNSLDSLAQKLFLVQDASGNYTRDTLSITGAQDKASVASAQLAVAQDKLAELTKNGGSTATAAAGSADTLRAAQDNLKTANDGVATAQLSLDKVIQQANSGKLTGQAATDALAAAHDRLSSAQDRAGTAGDRVNTAQGNLSGSQETGHQKALNIAQATDAVTQAEKNLKTANDDAAASTKSGTDALDENTQKGRDNISAIIDARDKIVEHAKAMLADKDDVHEVNLVVKDHIDKLDGELAAAGFTTGQIQQLNDEYGLTPDKVQTALNADINMNASQPLTALQQIQQALQTTFAQPGLNWAQAALALGALPPGQEAGGIVGGRLSGLAAGGVTSGPVIAGEGNGLYPEYIIPLDPKYRRRALEMHDVLTRDLLQSAPSLLMAAGGMLGAQAGYVTSGPVLAGEGNPLYPEYIIPMDPKYRQNALGLYWGLTRHLALTAPDVLGAAGGHPFSQYGPTHGHLLGLPGFQTGGVVYSGVAASHDGINAITRFTEKDYVNYLTAIGNDMAQGFLFATAVTTDAGLNAASVAATRVGDKIAKGLTAMGPTGSGGIATAQTWLGVPYLWGGGHGVDEATARRLGVDCSGLVDQVYHVSGNAWDQAKLGSAVPDLASAVSGDLVTFGARLGEPGVGGEPHHIGIYGGGGMMIDAPHTGTVVRWDNVGGFGPIYNIRRLFAPPTAPVGLHVTGGNIGLGQALAAHFGWGTGDEWGALYQVGMMESGWSNTALNASSGAYGIAQALPETKYPFAGTRAGGSDPATQIMWMLQYIQGRYRDPLGALAHEQQFHWYDQGGWLPPGTTIAVNTTGQPERVMAPGSGGVNVENGAVQVNLNFNGMNLSDQADLSRVRNMTEQAVNDAFEQLIDRFTAMVPGR